MPCNQHLQIADGPTLDVSMAGVVVPMLTAIDDTPLVLAPGRAVSESDDTVPLPSRTLPATAGLRAPPIS
jgi:hypothetical protein